MSKFLGLEGAAVEIVDKALWLIIAIGMLFIVFWIGKTGLTKLIQKYSVKHQNHQVATLLTVIRSAWKYLMLLIGVITILNVFGMSITANSLMAAAGAGGLIVGIGAQDFIKDILNGFTIITENQYSVGDYINVNGLCGTVVNLSLRTTRIIGDNEETISLPNSSVSSVINYSKRDPVVMCYVCIGDEEKLADAIKALEEMAKEFESGYATGRASLMGVTAIYPYGTEIGVKCSCRVGYILNLKYELNKEIALALIKAGIHINSENISITAGSR